MDSTPDLLRELLAGQQAVRRLLRGLVDDPSLGEDAVQDAWFVLAREDDAVARSRSWLAGVVRNLHRRRLRSEDRRRRAERRAPPRDEESRSAHWILEQEERRRAVVEALAALEDPYRSTLIARYYEGLEPVEIARRHGVPAATVRSHLRRGLLRLRAKLEERGGEPWLSCVTAILSGGGAEWASLGSSAGAGKLAMGGTLVKATPSSLAVVVVLLGLFGGTAWWWTQGNGTRPPSAEPLSPRAATVRGADEDGAVGAEERELVESVAESGNGPMSRAPSAPSFRLVRPSQRGALRLRVVDRAFRAMTEVPVRLVPSDGAIAEFLELERADGPELSGRSDANGELRFDDVPVGSYLAVPADGVHTGRTYAFAAASPALSLLVLERGEETRERTFAVRVRDEQDRPVAGAELRFVFGGNRTPALRASCDAEGRALFTVDARRRLDRVLLLASDDTPRTARHDFLGFAGELLAAARGADGLPELPIELETPAVLRGRLRGPGDLSSLRVEVVLRPQSPGEFAPEWRSAAPLAADGSFEFPPLPAGEVELRVSGDAPLRLARPERSLEPNHALHPWSPIVLALESGRVTEYEGELVAAASIEGRVLRAPDAEPVAGARVVASRSFGPVPGRSPAEPARAERWVPDERGVELSGPPLTTRETTTDAQGRYLLSNLPAGRYRIDVAASGRVLDACEIGVVDGDTAQVEHRLGEAGGLQILAWRTAYLGLRLGDATEDFCRLLAPDEPDPVLTVPGLPAGPVTIHLADANDWLDPVDLVTVELRAGELAIVDLRERMPERFGGTVVHRGGAVEGAVVDALDARAVTDAAGNFELGLAHPRARTVSVVVHPPVPRDAVSLWYEVPAASRTDTVWDRRLEIPDGRLRVTVRDLAGAPVSARVRLLTLESGGVEGPGSSQWTVLPTEPVAFVHSGERRTDTEGQVAFGGLPAGRYRVAATPEHGVPIAAVEVELAPQEDREVLLEDAGRCELEVRVEGEDARPLAGERVVVEVLLPDGRRVQTESRSGEDGRVLFHGLPEGEASVRLQPRGFFLGVVPSGTVMLGPEGRAVVELRSKRR